MEKGKEKELEQFNDNLSKINKNLQSLVSAFAPMKTVLRDINKSIEGATSGISSIKGLEIHNEEWKERLRETVEYLKDHFSEASLDIIEFADEMSKENIFLHSDYLSEFDLSGYDTMLRKDVVLSWMETSFDETLSKLTKLEFLIRHHHLIKQSANAYRRGEIEIAMIALYPVIDFFVLNWGLAQDKEGFFCGQTDSTQYLNSKRKKGIDKGTRQTTKEMREKRRIRTFFEGTALLGVYQIFVDEDKDGKKVNRLSRNKMLHGSYDYDCLTEEDYLKLFYWLYALTPLYEGIRTGN
ncbi:hypothetical protein EXIGUO8H_320004 [Exiguobacterium sp. 8H]|uniref:hypothetical protein n=1 Tax=unclassified Exiguobacterium TaxID=2644629 RepID=UPI0012F3EFDF|nr:MULTISPECIES: hypothetical protein [unclassified Exiguobacterium]VXB82557.1 hypothetical protein EXIGUO8H_320004 [Exiguobacterium sp. 8H]VXC04735.1 hypothetical protein EXIGUO8A_730004 [Exiguobacterium sp. 8A]